MKQVSLFRIEDDFVKTNEYREVVFLWMNITSTIFLIPFVFYNIVYYDFAIGFTGLAVALILLLNIISMLFRRKLFFNTIFTTVPVIIAIAVVTYLKVNLGAYWAFPAIIWIHFAHKYRTATYLNIALLVTVSLITITLAETEIAAKFSSTIILTGILANISSFIIEKQHRELGKMVNTDPLTGASSRRYMHYVVDDMILRFQRSGIPSSLFIFDIDYFKKLNDDYGHTTGDLVLKKIVAICLKRIRQSDKIFRYGGEEFVILFFDTDTDGAYQVADELRAKISSTPILSDRPVTISGGVSQVKYDDNLDKWLHRSDSALYRAKSDGRNLIIIGE